MRRGGADGGPVIATGAVCPVGLPAGRTVTILKPQDAPARPASRDEFLKQHERASLELRGGFQFVPWEPDIILPGQLRVPHAMQAEKMLMVAVMERAFADLGVGEKRAKYRGTEIEADAQRWIASDNERDLFSFASCCAHLGYSKDAIRRQLVVEGGEA